MFVFLFYKFLIIKHFEVSTIILFYFDQLNSIIWPVAKMMMIKIRWSNVQNMRIRISVFSIWTIFNFQLLFLGLNLILLVLLFHLPIFTRLNPMTKSRFFCCSGQMYLIKFSFINSLDHIFHKKNPVLSEQ